MNLWDYKETHSLLNLIRIHGPSATKISHHFEGRTTAQIQAKIDTFRKNKCKEDVSP